VGSAPPVLERPVEVPEHLLLGGLRNGANPIFLVAPCRELSALVSEPDRAAPLSPHDLTVLKSHVPERPQRAEPLVHLVRLLGGGVKTVAASFQHELLVGGAAPPPRLFRHPLTVKR
jgi:hypothetical protein